MNVREEMRKYIAEQHRSVGRITALLIKPPRRRRWGREQPKPYKFEPGVYEKVRGRWKKTDNFKLFSPLARRRSAK